MQCLKAMKRPIFDKLKFNIFEQSANEKNLFITQSQRSVLNFKFLDLTFLRSMSCSLKIKQKLSEGKFFQLQSMSNTIICFDEGLQ